MALITGSIFPFHEPHRSDSGLTASKASKKFHNRSFEIAVQEPASHPTRVTTRSSHGVSLSIVAWGVNVVVLVLPLDLFLCRVCHPTCMVSLESWRGDAFKVCFSLAMNQHDIVEKRVTGLCPLLVHAAGPLGR